MPNFPSQASSSIFTVPTDQLTGSHSRKTSKFVATVGPFDNSLPRHPSDCNKLEKSRH